MDPYQTDPLGASVMYAEKSQWYLQQGTADEFVCRLLVNFKTVLYQTVFDPDQSAPKRAD